ncbi:MAG: SAM-dependent methyltransferase [Chloroflexi bacterium HGW-Chloroflexi-9]|nr:MAG: SAM-dependent methyltransferase [Chloroflexi bacterium HGW-Chloroflexi-9]
MTAPLDDFALADEFALATESTPLLPAIRAHIQAAGGRITFAEFMGLALGHPEHGYYSRPGLRWGREGDFETSPEVHPIFGYLWARQVLECWERLGRPAPFHLVEPGAGSGAFMASMLTWLRARAPECFAAVRAVTLDGHPNRLADQRDALAARGLEGEHVLTEDWLARPEPVTGILISNEFFDALPAHLVERHGGDLLECYVTADGDALTLVTGEPSTPALRATFDRLGLLPGEGARAEVSLVAPEVMRRLASRIARGYVLTIDYGYPARELYASWRTQGTLMAFRRHSPQPDPLAQPGLTDLTYHVDFTSLAAAAGEGWQAAPLTSQSEALTVLGLAEAVQIASARSHEDVQRYAAERRAADTLVDPAGLGRIRVLAMAKDAPLEGLRCLQPLTVAFAGGRRVRE